MASYPAPSTTETDKPETATEQEQLAAMRAQADDWLVGWADGTDRTTTITWLAWYAREHDADATVTPLTDQ